MSQCLTLVGYLVKVIKLKLNPEKTEVMLAGKGEILKGAVLPSFDGVLLTVSEVVKSLGIILDPALLLEKEANAVPKNHFYQLQLS